MKKLFVPRGKVVHYEALCTDNLVVNGYLEVDGAIHARHITGGGVILAGSVTAETISAGEVEAGRVIAQRIAAHRMVTADCCGDTILVSGYLGAEHVKAGKLTVALSEISTLDAEEVVNLKKKHGIVGTLIRSWLYSVWMSLRYPEKKEAEQDEETQQEADVADADIRTDAAEPAVSMPNVPNANAEDAGKWNPDDADDFEFMRLKGLYSLLKTQGYTLRIIPIEENPNAEVVGDAA